MKVKYTHTFSLRLEKQIRYLNKHNKSAAKRFYNGLISKINQVAVNPYICRKSIYFNDNSIRDLVYKGHTVVFSINDDTIEVFGLVRYQENIVD